MKQAFNTLGQPVGPDLPGWTARPLPSPVVLTGRFCRLEPLNTRRHAGDLFEADSLETDGRSWTYLFTEPLTSRAAYEEWCAAAEAASDRLYLAIVDLGSGKAVGRASYMRIDPQVGSLEVGDVKYSPVLQRKPAATEAMYLMMRHAFEDLGYRRYEWKCDALNAPSKAAALRLGFTFEGIFRNATIYKGRSRDTAWFSVTDEEWPRLKAGFLIWLDPRNFDDAGRQLRRLSQCFAAVPEE